MDLTYLAALSQQEFEIERCRLIGEFLDSAPAEHRVKLLETQLKIDAIRDTVSHEELMVHLCREMSEAVENLSDQFVLIRNTLR